MSTSPCSEKKKSKIVNCRKPDWLRISRRADTDYGQVNELLRRYNLNTICRSGKCPNQAECWSLGTATFMLMGNICTRNCRFCATETGRPLPLDQDEPEHIALSVKAMKLRYVVLTCVTRDDLKDQGAQHWANTIEAIHAQCPDTMIEVLTADLYSDYNLIKQVADAKPHVFGHNLETVRRLTPIARSRATYDGSLKTLQIISGLGLIAKTGIMVGLGETEDEVTKTMQDAKQAGVRVFTIGQYLQPSKKHLPVEQYITPEQFEKYKKIGLEIGFSFVESGPLVRSSYHADKIVHC